MPRPDKSSSSRRRRRPGKGAPAGPADGAIIIFARAPVPGAVKTRLCPPLTPDEAATLYGSLVMDAVEHTKPLLGMFDVYVACTPDSAHPFFQTLACRHRIRLCEQVGDDLGRRMDHALTTTLNLGYRYALLVGTDIPALSRHHYEQAVEALQSNDVALGPTEDGGYYLVGVTRPVPKLFDGIPWSTDRVLTDSLAQAKRLGLTVGLMTRERDLDTFDDVQAFLRDADANADADTDADTSDAGRRHISTRTSNVFRTLLQRYGSSPRPDE